MAIDRRGRVSWIGVDRDRGASSEWGGRHMGPMVGTAARGGRISTSRELPIAIGGFYLQPRLPCIQRQIATGEIIVPLSLSPSPSLPSSLAVRLLTFTFGHSSPGKSFTSLVSLSRIVQSKFQRSGLCKWHRLVLYTVSPIRRVSFLPGFLRGDRYHRAALLFEKDRSKDRFFLAVW